MGERVSSERSPTRPSSVRAHLVGNPLVLFLLRNPGHPRLGRLVGLRGDGEREGIRTRVSIEREAASGHPFDDLGSAIERGHAGAMQVPEWLEIFVSKG